MSIKHQIADLLRIAKEAIDYCEVFSAYPAKVGKRNLDVNAKVDIFYTDIHNWSFMESLLIIGSLLDKKDTRVISLWNYEEFVAKKLNELENLTKKFCDPYLKSIRDQIIAHKDIDNKSNDFPYDRKNFLKSDIVRALREILEETIKEFCDFDKSYRGPYFNTRNNAQVIEQILNPAKPNLTDNHVI